MGKGEQVLALENKTKNQSKSITVVGGCSKFVGDLLSNGVVEILGKVEGTIRAKLIHIRGEGSVLGSIYGDEVKIWGRAEGEIAAGRLSLYPSSVVSGRIKYGFLYMESGSMLDGDVARDQGLLPKRSD